MACSIFAVAHRLRIFLKEIISGGTDFYRYFFFCVLPARKTLPGLPTSLMRVLSWAKLGRYWRLRPGHRVHRRAIGNAILFHINGDTFCIVFRGKVIIKSNVALVKQFLSSMPDESIDTELASIILALEDKRFFSHFGVDFYALIRAATRHVIGRTNGGASTIDMQLVRTITNRRDRTWQRKLEEMITAIAIRRQIGAHKILSAYCRIAYTGTGLRGIEAASQKLFGIPIDKCSFDQKVILAITLLHPIPEVITTIWWNKVLIRRKLAIRLSPRIINIANFIIANSKPR